MPSTKGRVNSNHIWIKWYISGAVQQPVFPRGSLVVNCAHAIHTGPLKNWTNLMLGEKENGESLCEVIVPTGVWGYDAGEILPKLPGNAVPTYLYSNFSNQRGLNEAPNDYADYDEEDDDDEWAEREARFIIASSLAPR